MDLPAVVDYIKKRSSKVQVGIFLKLCRSADCIGLKLYALMVKMTEKQLHWNRPVRKPVFLSLEQHQK